MIIGNGSDDGHNWVHDIGGIQPPPKPTSKPRNRPSGGKNKECQSRGQFKGCDLWDFLGDDAKFIHKHDKILMVDLFAIDPNSFRKVHHMRAGIEPRSVALCLEHTGTHR